MFKCSACNKASAAYEKPVTVVLERKMADHPSVYVMKKDKTMPGGRGSQIVREAKMCASCASKTWEAPLPQAVDADVAVVDPADWLAN